MIVFKFPSAIEVGENKVSYGFNYKTLIGDKFEHLRCLSYI